MDAGIILTLELDRALVWDEQLVTSLSNHRIIGHNVVYTRSELVIPMLLMPEQIAICDLYKICPVYRASYSIPTAEEIQQFEQNQQQKWAEFTKAKAEHDQLLKMIYTQKLSMDIPPKPEIPSILVKDSRLFPWYHLHPYNYTLDTLKFKVFKYFYDKGYYITNGLLFGGDYLLYEGEVNSCHAKYIVKVLNGDIKYLDMIGHSRLATTVNKIMLFARWDDKNDKLEVFSTTWTTWA